MGRISKTNRFDEELYKKTRTIARNTRIPFSRLLDEGLELLISKYSGQSMPEPETGTIKTLEFNNDVTASDLITMADAGRIFGILNSSTIPAWASKGFIKRYKNPGNLKGRSFVSRSELEKFLKERDVEPVIECDIVPMATICREFGLNDGYISRLAMQGRIKTYPRPADLPNKVQGRTFISRKEIQEYQQKNGHKKHFKEETQ